VLFLLLILTVCILIVVLENNTKLERIESKLEDKQYSTENNIDIKV
jgi:hypothetical protein